MTKRTFREVENRISFGLPGKFVAIEWDDQEVLDVFSYGFPICPPKGGDGIKDDG